MTYRCALENRDIARIDKLNELSAPESFWDDVRKLTKKVCSEHAIRRWEILAEKRWEEIK